MTKTKKGWHAPNSMPASWTGENFTLTGVCEFSGTLYCCGKGGVLGKSVDGENWTEIITGTKVDFWQIVPGTNCMWIAATDGLWRYTPGKKPDNLWSGTDIKDIAVDWFDQIFDHVYCGGYEGGLFFFDGSPKTLLNNDQAPAVRSVCIKRNVVLVGSKNGFVNQWDISDGKRLGAFNGVEGNGVILSNGDDGLYAHRDVMYAGKKFYTVPPNKEKKTPNVSCGKWIEDRVELLGEDGMHLTVDLENMKVIENSLYTKGLFLACETFKGKLVGVGSGIKDDNDMLSPIILIDVDDIPVPPTPLPPGNNKQKLIAARETIKKQLTIIDSVIDVM